MYVPFFACLIIINYTCCSFIFCLCDLSHATVRIRSYDIQYYTDQLQTEIYFDGVYNPAAFGCFHDKLYYGSSDDPTASTYRTMNPRISGNCQALTGETRITWDNRDFLDFIDNGFTSDRQNVYLYTILEDVFSSHIIVEQISNTEPLLRANFYNHSDSDTVFEIISMDVYRAPSTMSLYIHFDAIVDANSLNLTDVTLSSNGNTVGLISPIIQNPGFAKSVHIRISDSNRDDLIRLGMCVSPANCSIIFSNGGFVNSHAGSNTIGQQTRGARRIWSIDNFGE